METPVYFLSDDAATDPVTTTRSIPKFKNVQEIRNAQRILYKRSHACYIQQGRFGYYCSLFKFDFFNKLPVTWWPVSREPRVLLIILLNNDVPCELFGHGEVNLQGSFMYLMYLPGGAQHVANFPAGHTEVVHINIDVSLLEKLVPDFPWVNTLLSVLQQQSEKGVLASEVRISGEICVQLHKIFKYKDNERSFKRFLRTRVIDILHEYTKELELAGGDKTKPYTFYEKIMMAKDIIDLHDQEKVTLTAMARHIGLSKTDLQKGFMEIVGTTYDKYQVEVKMQRAARLLLNNQLSIGQIAEQLGYDPSNFGKAFEKRFQLTPSAYRKKYRRNH